MPTKKTTSNRRSFVKQVSAGLFAFPFLPRFPLGSDRRAEVLDHLGRFSGPNDTVRICCIGMGIRGFILVDTALQLPGVELVGVCDVYEGRLERSREVYGKDLFCTRDYREIISRPDVDAVFVATSDHWHDHITIAALRAGKAVYCEKPMVHQIDEGKAVLAAEKESGQVLMVGSQRVSSILLEKAKELYERGDIGQLNLVETYNDRFSSRGAWQYSIPTDASMSTVDWDGFLGDAPEVDFDPKRLFWWRNYKDYGTGVAGDLFVHLFSGLHLITGSNGPDRIYATGGLRYWEDGRDVPDVFIASLDYATTRQHPAFNVQMRVNFVDGGGGGSRTRLVGDEGTMDISSRRITVSRKKLPATPGYGGYDSYGTFSEAQQKDFAAAYQKQYPAATPEVIGPNEFEYRTPDGYSDALDHLANFFYAVRTDGKVVEDGAFGFRAAAPSLAANLSYFERRVVEWDPEAMELK